MLRVCVCVDIFNCYLPAAAAAACVNVDGKSILFFKPNWFPLRSATLPLLRCKFNRHRSYSRADNNCSCCCCISATRGCSDSEADEFDDDADDADDEPDDSEAFAAIWLFTFSSIWLMFGDNWDFLSSSKHSLFIVTPSAADDSFSQMLAGDQIIAFEFVRFDDFIDRFNGSSSSISVVCSGKKGIASANRAYDLIYVWLILSNFQLQKNTKMNNKTYQWFHLFRASVCSDYLDLAIQARVMLSLSRWLQP